MSIKGATKSIIDDDDKNRKQLKNAPPPTEAVIIVLFLLVVSLYFLPGCIEEIVNNEATPQVFMRRLYPDYVSVEGVINMRLAFGLLCFGVTLIQVTCLERIITPAYLRPKSKLMDVKIIMKGSKFLYMFTSWTWLLLGGTFLLSSYITWSIHNSGTAPQWLLVLTLMAWKTSAPLTLLVGSIVKYVLWPATYKKQGPNHTFKSLPSLLQHNFNIVMALTELLLIGGLPVRLNHIVLPLLFGIVYVFFSWSTMNHWNPKTGPAAVYFFFDTTLGRTHTIALIMLLGALTLFYVIFCVIEYFISIGSQGIGQNLIVIMVICLATCRIND